ncbi:hypothetical protein [Cytobacillus gottheilii]|uniref:hypothetical protein n=1 Tax=Cytobacillus gottheilii TaxID=859144 RepID=UPI0024943C4F|nr:hypothetical protein [Cytobacillus gottheilii]
MFVLIRNISGTTEHLKNSNSQSSKTFEDYSEADDMAKKLNQNTIPSHKWHVKKI